MRGCGAAGGGGAGGRWCAALLVCAALAHLAAPDKRAEMSPAPFVMGSRYGRSPPRLLAPRNDRFFMGSRYGKRSGGGGGGAGGAGGAGGWGGAGRAGGGRARALVCQYTGVSPLYRCVPRYGNRAPEDARRSGQQ